MKSRFKRTATAGLVAAVAATGLSVATSAPAQAATPVCTKIGNWQSSQIWVPAMASGLPLRRTVVPDERFDCHLGRGDSGPAVEQLQVTLETCYGRHVRDDGIFGRQTERALKDVQASIDTRADGVYGPATRRKMKFVGSGGCNYTSETATN